jgi:hypothetical protein
MDQDEKRKIEHLAAVETNLVFIFMDILEQLWIECCNLNRQCGLEFKHEQKRSYNNIKHNLQLFRGTSRQLSQDDQMQYGDDADITLDILYAAVSRTGSDNMMLCRFLEYMMSFPDKLGLDSVRKGSEAFEAIKKKLNLK